MNKIVTCVVVASCICVGEAHSNENLEQPSGSNNTASSDKGDIVRLAREHVNTLSKIDQYRREKAFYEQQAKIYNELYNRAKAVEYMLGFYHGKYPAPCGIQLGKTTKKDVIKKFGLPRDYDPNEPCISFFSGEIPVRYKNYVTCMHICFDKKDGVATWITIDFDDDYLADFVRKVQSAGYRRIEYVHNGIIFQQKEMPIEVTIKNSFKNLTSVNYRKLD